MLTALAPNTALVLIDLQKGIVIQPLAHPLDAVLANAARLITAFRAAGQPVVIVNVNPGGPWLKTRKAPQPARPPMTAEGLEIVAQVPTAPTDIRITKPGWNAFFGTDLHQQLQARDITGIVLGGVSTGIGVQGTARAATELGYNLTFAHDAMTDSNAASHEVAVQVIFPRIGEVGSTDEVLALL